MPACVDFLSNPLSEFRYFPPLCYPLLLRAFTCFICFLRLIGRRSAAVEPPTGMEEDVARHP